MIGHVLLLISVRTQKHGNIVPIVGDITSKPDLERIAAQIEKEVGFVNLVVANAGVNGPSFGEGISIYGPKQSTLSEIQKDLWSVNPETFTNLFDVNVRGVFFTIAAFLGLLDAGNKKGNVSQTSQVVVTSSIAGFNRVPFAHYAYTASKAAVTHMTQNFATTFGGLGIRFNIIAPGLYPSEMTTQVINNIENLSPQEKAFRVSPLGRPGSTEDMAGAILWLASKAGAWLHGNVVLSDGGKVSVVPGSY